MAAALRLWRPLAAPVARLCSTAPAAPPRATHAALTPKERSGLLAGRPKSGVGGTHEQYYVIEREIRAVSVRVSGAFCAPLVHVNAPLHSCKRT